MALIPAVFLAAIVGSAYMLRGTLSHKPACVLDSCPFEIHEEDSGGAFTYRLTSRFTLLLDSTKHPVSMLSVICAPEQSIGNISTIPAVDPPLYAVRFEGVLPGACTVSDGDFRVTIKIVSSD